MMDSDHVDADRFVSRGEHHDVIIEMHIVVSDLEISFGVAERVRARLAGWPTNRAANDRPVIPHIP